MDAAAAPCVRLPTLREVVKDLGVEALGHQSPIGHGCPCRVFVAQSARAALALQIDQQIRQVNATLAAQDRRALGMVPKGRRA